MPGRRRFFYYDEQAESFDEMLNPRPDEDYIDYRTYPLKINWPTVENPDSEANEILEKLGYVGVSLFTHLSKHVKFNSENFLKSILDFYIKNYENNINNSLENFIENLPKLKNLKIILQREILTRKDILVFKIILDIYEHYYKKFDLPHYEKLLSEYLPVAFLFYQSISDEDVKSMYDQFQNLREEYEYIVIKMKSLCSKKKKVYIKHLNEIKNDLINIIGGIQIEKLCT